MSSKAHSRLYGWANGQTIQVLRFSLEIYDLQTGNRTQMKSVEMRGISAGSINDGDWVKVFGKLKGGRIHSKLVENVSHGGARVEARVSSGKQATTTLSITAKILANQVPPPEQTYTYHVTLVQDGSKGWMIDSMQPQ